jgi:hypothetical protein
MRHLFKHHALSVVVHVHGEADFLKDPIVLLVVEEGVRFDLGPGEPFGVVILKAAVDEV